MSKEKSLNELFGLQRENMNDFEVRLELFDYGLGNQISTLKSKVQEGK